MAILEEIGLSKREAEIYETLLRLGNSPIADVLTATGFHSQVVYRVLDNLERKGLLIRSRRGHKTYVRAENPKKFEEIEKLRLEELHKKITALMALQQSSKEAVVRVSYGEEAIRALRMRGVEELGKGETYYIIGGSGSRFYEVMADHYEKVERKRIRKRILMKLVTFESQREMIEKNSYIKEYTNFRYLPEQFSIPSSTNIFNDTVAILIWSHEPIVITIESPEVAESYKHYFSTLWRMAQA